MGGGGMAVEEKWDLRKMIDLSEASLVWIYPRLLMETNNIYQIYHNAGLSLHLRVDQWQQRAGPAYRSVYQKWSRGQVRFNMD